MIAPKHIIEAVYASDTQTVELFLDAGGDVNATWSVRGYTLLMVSVSFSRVEMCRLLVARGADPKICSCGTDLIPAGQIYPLSLAIYAYGGIGGGMPHPGSVILPAGVAWPATPSGELFKILVESGADFERAHRLWGYDRTECRVSLVAEILLNFGRRVPNDHLSLEITTALLRAGARVESIVEHSTSGETFSASWCLDQALAARPELAEDECFIKAKELIVGIQEDGSFKRFMRRPHRSVLRLRSLFARGRATPPCAIRCRRMRCYGAARQDYAMEFLIKQPDNGIAWNILSFWRAST